MKNTRIFLALLLSLTLVFALAVPAYADYDYAANARIIHSDYTGKTVILHSNDVHGHIDGYAAMAALKTHFTEAGAKVIVVDAGDFSQGTTYVSSTKGADAIKMMNVVGYDIATLGNHDLDFGYAQLQENLKEAKFSVICADVYLDETGETILPAATVIEVDVPAAEGEEDAHSLRIGFFGMETPETATKVNPGLIKEISFATFDDLYASAQLAIDSLKEQDADLIIGLTHLGVDQESAQNGYRSVDLYANVTDVDFLIDGQRIRVLFRKPVVYVNGPVKQGKQRGQDVNSGFLSFKALTRETNCFTGEDDCHWCFHFEDGKFLEYSGNTFFEYDIPCCPKKDCIFSDGERCRASLINSLYNKAVPWERSHLDAPPTQLVSPFRIQEAVFMTITCCCSFPQGIEQRHPQKAV